MKRTQATTMQGALAGGTSGAGIGTSILPGWGTAIGAGVGAIGGGIAGYFAGEADKPFDALNMEEQRLSNEILRKKARDANTMARSGDIMRGFLGAAFRSGSPASMATALKAYPGLGNQVPA